MQSRNYYGILPYIKGERKETVMGDSLGNKQIMAKNIKFYMDMNGVTRSELANAIETPYTTVCGWLSAQTYPRIDKIELMARYFGIAKRDLVEENEPDLSSYYLSARRNESPDEVTSILQTLHDRPEMKMLFDSAKDATADQIKQIATLLDSFKKD